MMSFKVLSTIRTNQSCRVFKPPETKEWPLQSGRAILQSRCRC